MGKRFKGIRGKLVSVFVLIKVLPLVVLAWFAWHQITTLGWTVREKTEQLVFETQQTVGKVGGLAVDSSIKALDLKSRESIERLTTDTARQVAAFLYQRDHDVEQAAGLVPSEESYRRFLKPLRGQVIQHAPWALNANGTAWESTLLAEESAEVVAPVNMSNAKEFHARSASGDHTVEVPLYREMTFVDMTGQERVKVTTSGKPTPLRNISSPVNSYCNAERYYQQIKRLKPGEMYVSEVIGEYLPSPIIGPYTPERAKKLGVPFEPEKAGYAGKENPVGRRYQGIVRWATPVFRNGHQLGWVTLALDHTHIMEFTDHILPTAERYTDISDASSGNYAFMWDFLGRNISHPRDYFITGYDARTGEPAVPWLEASLYTAWQKSGQNATAFLHDVPTFDQQSLSKKASPELQRAGMVGLDGRYLNFAPQCTGWHNLTQHGGSGSFIIFWSGLWKLTTAATIPYYTGQYANTPRGFGYVTIGANVDEFHLAATQTAKKLDTMVAQFIDHLGAQNQETQALLADSLQQTAHGISMSTALMVMLVICIAIVMAAALTGKITRIIDGIRKFQAGDMDHRLAVESEDEIGQLCTAFNETSSTIKNLVYGLQSAEEKHRSIIENAVEGIYQSTMDGRYLKVNPAMVRLLGYESEEQLLTEMKVISEQLYVNPADRTEMIDILRREATLSNFEFPARRRNGEKMWLSTNARAVRDPAGNIEYIEGTVVDISSRKDMEEAERNREAAEARDQSKSVFLANMSHEIRTPMNAIIGVTELLQEGSLDENQQALVSLLRSSGEHLLVLINDILDVSQIEAGKLSLTQERFSLRDVIYKTVALMAVKAKEKGLILTPHLEATVPEYLVGDAARIRQVLINLIGNAVKFTDHGAVVLRVGLEDRIGSSVVIKCSVQDTGEGIPASKLDSIFDSFVQVDSSMTRRHGGTGLGLAISKKLVTLMGGEIWAESVEGKGSTIVFTLVLGEASDSSHAGVSPVPPRQPRVSEDDGEWGRGLRVLYVDDSESNRMLVSLYLGKTLMELELAEDGATGLEMIGQSTYDIILLDMEMPGMDGYAVAAAIRASEKGRDVPIVALTANAMADDRQRCIRAGCTEYLAKPVRKDALMQMIYTLVVDLG